MSLYAALLGPNPALLLSTQAGKLRVSEMSLSECEPRNQFLNQHVPIILCIMFGAKYASSKQQPASDTQTSGGGPANYFIGGHYVCTRCYGGL